MLALNSRNEHRNSILMMRHHLDLGSACYWLKRISHAARPMSSSTQIFVVMLYQYGISALVLRRHFAGKPVVASWNVSCCLKLCFCLNWRSCNLLSLACTSTSLCLVWKPNFMAFTHAQWTLDLGDRCSHPSNGFVCLFCPWWCCLFPSFIHIMMFFLLMTGSAT